MAFDNENELAHRVWTDGFVPRRQASQDAAATDAMFEEIALDSYRNQSQKKG